MTKKIILAIAICLGLNSALNAQQKTYCNPVNLDYGFTPIPNFSESGKHRATADPVIVNYKKNYFLFSTNQWGYWYSPDMSDWTFISRKFLRPWNQVYDELCAPAVWISGDTMFVVGSTQGTQFTIWESTNPFKDDWQIAIDSSKAGAWDPAYFLDDDGKVFLYYGSSNFYPMYGYEISRKTLQPISERKELIRLHDDIHGWERFGEYNDNNFLDPFMEGAWMTKHDGKYYLQYGAPGTEFSGYADGVYTADQPFGPFTYQAHNPFCTKPGGFVRGSGHGSTYQDNFGNWWHVTTLTIAVKNNFERRNGIFPAGFDMDGILYANTTFGDYPQYLPTEKTDHTKGTFTGWMLLNYEKPVRVSSTLGGFKPNYSVDEDIKTYWSAKTSDAGEWLESDLGEVSEIRAIQINYADQDAEYLGKRTDIFHQYKVSVSDDQKNWKVIIDKSKNNKDVPHDYVELEKPVTARFVKLENSHMASGKFAISGFRVFGKGNGKVPDEVKGFIVLRQQKDPRNAWIKWNPVEGAIGYNIYQGIAKEKLYTSIMVYGKNEYNLKNMTIDQDYYFCIEAFNENGISLKTQVIEVKYK